LHKIWLAFAFMTVLQSAARFASVVLWGELMLWNSRLK